ncbi:MAG: hypothetical protein FWD52_08300 [Candidatus Bathyarchaeota archaeon]|nr:hypothetical protein [Candidatus Termiticorpusculum sp.]
MKTFDLSAENICIEKFKPWFEDRGWTVQHFTNAKSAEFQIPDVLNKIKPCTPPENLKFIEIELKKFADSMDFPHDGEATRGAFMFCFDYKYIDNSSKGIWVIKEAYNKYLSWKKPYFYLLFYAADTGKLYSHQIRDPKEAGYEEDDSIYGKYKDIYYNLTKDCVELSHTDVPITFPKPTDEMSEVESFALMLAGNRWTEQGYKGEFEGYTDEDLAKAREFFEQSPARRCYHRLNFRKRIEYTPRLKPLKRAPSKHTSNTPKSSKGNTEEA